MALQGDIKAIKQIIKWAEAYFPKWGEDYALKPGFHLMYLDIDQAEVDSLRERGYLPENCPQLLENIPARTLNKARARWQKDWRQR
jgi:hypothetical protein